MKPKSFVLRAAGTGAWHSCKAGPRRSDASIPAHDLYTAQFSKFEGTETLTLSKRDGDPYGDSVTLTRNEALQLAMRILTVYLPTVYL